MGYVKELAIEIEENDYKEKRQGLLESLYFYAALEVSGIIGLLSLIFTGFTRNEGIIQGVIFRIFIAFIVGILILFVLKYTEYYKHITPERNLALFQRKAKSLFPRN